MGNIYIKDIQFADTSKIEDGILYVDKGAVKAVALEDEHIKTVTFDIAKPGESVRITPVKDVIEPRVKVEGKGGVFPGIISKVDTVGSGKTYALKGMAVVTAGRIVGFQEGIIDMTGPGADYTPFSKTESKKESHSIRIFRELHMSRCFKARDSYMTLMYTEWMQRRHFLQS